MLPAALFLGAVAISAGRSWVDREVARQVQERALAAPAPVVVATPAASPQMATVVVAAQPLRYGTEITASQLKEIPWAAGDLPTGAFARVSEVFADKQRRAALAAIEPNEPLLASKITGPGQRANLAALIHEDMKAVTVRVDDVVGVAGFVLPGDMVDVILTRAPEKADATSDVILQDIRVLAVDQLTDAQTSKPSIARAVTLEVATQQAQRLAVAQQVGTLTLALRAAGQRSAEAPLRVTASQLSATPAPAAPEAAAPQRSTQTTIGVTRRSERHEYTVPRDGGSLAQ